MELTSTQVGQEEHATPLLIAVARQDLDFTIVSVKPKHTRTAVACDTIYTCRSILAWQRRTLIHV